MNHFMITTALIFSIFGAEFGSVAKVANAQERSTITVYTATVTRVGFSEAAAKKRAQDAAEAELVKKLCSTIPTPNGFVKKPSYDYNKVIDSGSKLKVHWVTVEARASSCKLIHKSKLQD